MREPPPPSNGRYIGTLKTPTAAERREVMRRWDRIESGMEGERAGLPATPNDAVAYRLLEAADAAMGRGEWRKGSIILRLVVKEYRDSAEAAFARRVIDRLAGASSRHGR